MEKLVVKIGWSGDNFSALIENVDGMVIATGKTLENVKKKIKGALDFHIAQIIEDGGLLPENILKGNYELDYELQSSAILKVLDKTITRAALHRATGINERQLGHYIQGRREGDLETRKKIVEGIKKLSEDISQVV